MTCWRKEPWYQWSWEQLCYPEYSSLRPSVPKGLIYHGLVIPHAIADYSHNHISFVCIFLNANLSSATGVFGLYDQPSQSGFIWGLTSLTLTRQIAQFGANLTWLVTDLWQHCCDWHLFDNYNNVILMSPKSSWPGTPPGAQEKMALFFNAYQNYKGN